MLMLMLMGEGETQVDVEIPHSRAGGNPSRLSPVSSIYLSLRRLASRLWANSTQPIESDKLRLLVLDDLLLESLLENGIEHRHKEERE